MNKQFPWQYFEQFLTLLDRFEIALPINIGQILIPSMLPKLLKTKNQGGMILSIPGSSRSTQLIPLPDSGVASFQGLCNLCRKSALLWTKSLQPIRMHLHCSHQRSSFPKLIFSCCQTSQNNFPETSQTPWWSYPLSVGCPQQEPRVRCGHW